MSVLNPHLTTIEPWTSAGLRHVVQMTNLQGVFPAAFQQVAAEVSKAGGALTGPAYAGYFGVPTDTIDVEIGFGIDHRVDAPTLVVSEHPAVQAAVGTHVGSYELLEKSYAEMMPWLADQHLELDESMLEFYDSPPETDPDEAVTRLVFPLA